MELKEPSTFNTGILLLEGEIKVKEEHVCKDNEFILNKFGTENF